MEKSYKKNHVGVKYVGPAELIVSKEYVNKGKEDCYIAKVKTLNVKKVTEKYRIPLSSSSKNAIAFVNFCDKNLKNKKEFKFKEKVQLDSWSGLTIPAIGMKDC